MVQSVMKSDNGYKTYMNLSASLTGNTKGNEREVSATLSLYFADSGYGSYAYAPVKYTLSVGGSEKASWAPTEVSEGEQKSLSWKGYITASQTIEVKGAAYTAWADANFSYPPNPQNGGNTLSLSLALPALQSEIKEADDFVLEDCFKVKTEKHDPSFTDNLQIKIDGTLIKSLPNYQSEDEIKLTSEELLSAYEALGEKNAENAIFLLTTQNGSSTVGTSQKEVIAKAEGTIRVLDSNKWHRGMCYIKKNGTWKKAVANVKADGKWKRGE